MARIGHLVAWTAFEIKARVRCRIPSLPGQQDEELSGCFRAHNQLHDPDHEGLQHLQRSPFSVLALKVIDSSMVSVSPDVDREGLEFVAEPLIRLLVFEVMLAGPDPSRSEST